MANQKKVNVDVEKLKKWIFSQPETVAEIANRIGKSNCYFNGIYKSGSMPIRVYDLLRITYGLPEDAFKVPEPEEEKTEPDIQHRGYWGEATVFSDKALFTLNFSECGVTVEVAHAYSRIKDQTELGIAQALSYAAHMVYKIVEQNTLDK